MGNAQNKSSSKNSTSKYVGINFDKKRKKWDSRIHVLGKYMRIGLFNTELEAAIARDNYILELRKTNKDIYYKLNLTARK